MKRSYIADSINREYKLKQAYQRKKRQRCKEVDCKRCKYLSICTEGKYES